MPRLESGALDRDPTTDCARATSSTPRRTPSRTDRDAAATLSAGRGGIEGSTARRRERAKEVTGTDAGYAARLFNKTKTV